MSTKELFPLGSQFPSTKSITFDNKKGGMDLLVHYSPTVTLVSGLPVQVAQYKVKEGNPKHEKHQFVFRVSNNIHQIPCLESAELIEEWVEEEKIPVKKDKPASAQKKPEDNKGDNPDQQPGEAPMQTDETPKQDDPQIEYEIKKKNKKTTTAL